MDRKRWCVWTVLGLLLASAAAPAQVVVNPLFSDHAVLQRELPIPVWGTAAAGEKVLVKLGDNAVLTTAGADGRWLAKLAPMAAGGPFELTVQGTNVITVKDVLVGEVWVCSGQSNMQMTVNSTANAAAAIAAANDPSLRLLTVPRHSAIEPLTSAPVKWELCTPQTVPGFTAVGYFFGQRLRAALNVPVGLINSSVGGTPAEAWTSYGTLFMEPELRPLCQGFQKALDEYSTRMRDYRDKVLPRWQDEVKKAKADKRQPPRQPGPPMGPNHQSRPAGLYNGMIAPLIPYAIRGAIWYQGEANAGRAAQYRTLFPTMIRDWRQKWGQGEFPFYFVQLAPFMKIRPEPSESNWAELREAQLYTQQTVPHTHMAVITDVGDELDIHPKQKQPVGERLAFGALRLIHGQSLVCSGPVFESLWVEGAVAHLRFVSTAGRLEARGGALKGFAVAGSDRRFYWAEARLVGSDEVAVTCPQVAHPVAVRYGWADYPVVNLWNRAGLPASPFRTDQWPRSK